MSDPIGAGPGDGVPEGTGAEGANGTPLLSVRGLVKHFGGVKAVVDGNLRVRRGEIVGLVGPNGCGKSTTLNVVSGLLRPDRGEVLFDGDPVPFGDYAAMQAAGVYLVPQELALAPEDTVWESIVLGAEPRSGGLINRRAARRMAAEGLAVLDHDLPLNASVSSLSPVERRLVMLARGTAHPHVRLLILDEPTAGLPHSEAERVINAMRRMVSSERSLILVSHHIDEVADACHTVTVMRDGATVTTMEDDEVSKEAILALLLADVHTETVKEAGAPVPEQGESVAEFSDVHGHRLDGISLKVHRGEVLGIAGILGSGATELAQHLTGQVQPESGEVRVSAEMVRPSSVHKALHSGVGFISGDRSSLVIAGMSVSEHVALPFLHRFARLGLISGRKEREAVAKSLEDLSVVGGPATSMTSLSGGNQQRALVARWINSGIDVLVVDQPTVGVDIAGRIQLLRVLRELATERAVVVVGEPDELALTCDRVLCMRRGKIAAEMTGDDVDEHKILDKIT